MAFIVLLLLLIVIYFVVRLALKKPAPAQEIINTAGSEEIFDIKAYEIYKQAVSAYQSGDINEAITLCHQSLQRTADDFLTFQLLGELHEKIGDFPLAIKYHEEAEKNKKDLLPYPRSLALRRAEAKKEYSHLLQNNDLNSLVALEKMYSVHDLRWPWPELRDYADKFRKHGDHQHALTWLNGALQARMMQMSFDIPPSRYDSALGSLYTARGIIYMKLADHGAALRQFLIATIQYDASPTKLLSSKTAVTIKRLGITEDIWSSIVSCEKKSGLSKAMVMLDELLSRT